MSSDDAPSRRICFVCTGNTCRSQMAQAMAERLCADDPSLVFQSAGTAATPGTPASTNAVAVLDAWGVPSWDGISTRVTADHHQGVDEYVCMTRSQAEEVSRLLPDSAKAKVRTLLPGVDAPDPKGGSVEVYEATRKMIEAGVRLMLRSQEPTAEAE
jgi:protein-tyrosine-phosphatase